MVQTLIQPSPYSRLQQEVLTLMAHMGGIASSVGKSMNSVTASGKNVQC
jgi:hypothetical protein